MTTSDPTVHTTHTSKKTKTRLLATFKKVSAKKVSAPDSEVSVSDPKRPPSDPRWTDFIEKCVFIDLEAPSDHEDGQINELGALHGKQKLRSDEQELRIRRPSKSPAATIRRLNDFVGGAQFLVGHNIVAYDRPLLATHLQGLNLQDLAVVDTLYLSPLASPQQPYHKLVKDYKLISSERNDPVADCRLTKRLLADCWRLLREQESNHPGLLSFYKSCFQGLDDETNKTAQFLNILDGHQPLSTVQPLSNYQIAETFKGFVKDQACHAAIDQQLASLLVNVESRPAVAYALAWILVANTDSILPRWVHHTFPQTTQLIRAVRAEDCSSTECDYCSKHLNPTAKLEQYFGFSGFRSEPKTPTGESLQQQIVDTSIARRPLLGIMPTGGGKSLCYQLPAILQYEQTGALTVVISPLQALMKDQVENLNKRTQSPSLAAALNGLLTMPERQNVLEGIRLGRYALLYVSPEQLRNTTFVKTIKQREIASWVFDEAHCISKWGHDFRPDYYYAVRFIAEHAQNENIAAPPVACYTATAKVDVQEEIVALIREKLNQQLNVISGDRLDRDNLQYSVEELRTSAKPQRIHQLLTETFATHPRDAVIIYASSRSRTEELASRLRDMDWQAEHFHAGMDIPDKARVQERFIAGELPVIVATNAFGMGIDKDNVRLVVHLDIPGSIENYLQEAGRAGRDGKQSRCVLLFTKGDLDRQFTLVSKSQITRRDIAQILRAVRRVRDRFRRVDEIVVSPAELLRVPDIDTTFNDYDQQADTKVRIAISWLERAHFLQRNENQIRVFQAVPKVVSEQEAENIMSRLDLPTYEQQRWMEVLQLLRTLGVREGVDTDRIAALPSFASLFKHLHERHKGDPGRVNRESVVRIFTTLHNMSRAGLLDEGIYFSAWIRHKSRGRWQSRMEEIRNAQAALLDLLGSPKYQIRHGEDCHLTVASLREGLRAQGVNLLNDSLRKLLDGWAREGFGSHPPVSLKTRGSHGMSFRLRVSWSKLRALLELRNWTADIILEHLTAIANQTTETGERLIRFSLKNLHQDLDDRIWPYQDENIDPFDLIQKTLLFLDEHQVIRLDQSMSIFRPAMKLRLQEEAKGRSYTKADYSALAEHYQERIFQVHAIGRYVEARQTSEEEANQYLGDYFAKPVDDFKRSRFRGLAQALRRPTSEESYKRIVTDLNNEAQQRIVRAPKDRNLMVLAGPGSGKTRVVVHRCAYLLQVKRVLPQNLLVICFNRSSMFDLRKRLRELVDADLAARVAVHTYHSLALRLTERSLSEARVETGEQIDFDEMIKEANRLLSGENVPAGVGDDGLQTDGLRDRLLAGFEYVLVDEYQDIDKDQYEMITHIARQGVGNGRDDDRYAAILAVGDDDQSIYEWREADVEFLRRFEDEFAAERHYLTYNYRSTHHIIDVSNRLIGANSRRMKADHPIEIDPARSNDPPGVEVRLMQVAGAIDEGAALVAEIERLRTSGSGDWHNFAVVGRTHKQVAAARAFLRSKRIRVRWAIKNGMPWLGHIREFRLLLDHLNAHNLPDTSLSGLRKNLPQICGADTLWTKMADRMLAELENSYPPTALYAPTPIPAQDGSETGATAPTPTSEVLETSEVAPTSEVLETIHRMLDDSRGSHIVGDGVLVGTAHSVKGLEFPHMIVLGGGWGSRTQDSRTEQEQERRLYYVAMTRACQTLTLMSRDDDPLPYVSELVGPGSVSRRSTLAPSSQAGLGSYRSDCHGSVQDGFHEGYTYTTLGMEDLVLSFAGYKPRNHSIHRALEGLRTGKEVWPKLDHNGSIYVHDHQNVVIAKLSRRATEKWSDRLGDIKEIHVLALVSRYKKDQEPPHRDRIQTDHWEIPILEVHHRSHF